MSTYWKKGRIRGIKIYRQDVVIDREAPGKPKPERQPRGEITMFSQEARKRLAFIASNTEIDFYTMITLTYPGTFTTDGVRVKADLYKMLKWQQRRYGAHSYLWFIEFQARGAPHFHILVNRVFGPIEIDNIRHLTSKKWYEIVGSGDVRHLRAGVRIERLRSPEGGRRYAVKYAMKAKQKAVPKQYRSVGRFFGYSSDVKPSPVVPYVSMGEEEIMALLGDWQYLPDNPQDLHRVLFNTSARVAARMVTGDYSL
jgi:hypothetical protein